MPYVSPRDDEINAFGPVAVSLWWTLFGGMWLAMALGILYCVVMVIFHNPWALGLITLFLAAWYGVYRYITKGVAKNGNSI